MKIIELRPPRIAIALLVIATVVNWLLDGGGSHFASPFLGGLLGGIGTIMMLWPWWLFKKHALALCPTAETAQLITGGPYRFSRNPMYLGMVLMMLGLAVFIGKMPYYLAAVLYFTILHTIFCPYEEEKLTQTFGDQYRDYAHRVRRWL
jgi:protein-S-isoprenylcysteine O-methyltransferase Ste14